MAAETNFNILSVPPNIIKECVALLAKLIAIPSSSREEGAAADFLESTLRARGLDVRRAGCNLWVESEPPGTKPTVMLNAHTDTVRPGSDWQRDPYAAQPEGDRLYGLGSNDCGGALVSLVAAYEALTRKAQPCRYVLTLTAEEEVSGTGGLELLFPHLGRVDFGLIGEPTGMQMAVAEKGLMVLDCEAHGRSGHAARDEGVNAIYEALPAIRWFQTHRFPRVSPFLGAVKTTVTQIEAGSQHNVVPDVCRFVVDVRPNGEYSNAALLQEIKAAVPCEVRARSTRLNSSSLPADHPAVRRGTALGLRSYGSPTLSNQALCPFPTLKLGPGESARSHTADEYVTCEEIAQGIQIYTALLDGLTL